MNSKTLFNLPFLFLLAFFYTKSALSFSPFELLKPDDEKKDEENISDILESDMFTEFDSEGDIQNAASIIILDKRSGKPSSPIQINAGKAFTYHNITLTLGKCWQEKEMKWDRDSRALISFSYNQTAAASIWVSSKFPGLSSINDPRFEILLQKCI